jgi:hypothetical protein
MATFPGCVIYPVNNTQGLLGIGPASDHFANVQIEDHKKIIKYIRNSHSFIASSGDYTNCNFCSNCFPNSEFYTDGKWLWPARLDHFFDFHNFILPEEFLSRIRLFSYIVPELCRQEFNFVDGQYKLLLQYLSGH